MKQREVVFEEFSKLEESASRVLLATGRLIGEGFDYPPLDTLVLALPISWKGTLQQYAGRLHREHAEKHDVRIYDYIDGIHPLLFVHSCRVILEAPQYETETASLRYR